MRRCEHGEQSFWQLLAGARLTDQVLAREDDATLLHHRVGLTGLVKGTAQSHERGAVAGTELLLTP